MLGGLAAGNPQVVVPIGADQPQNAQSVAAIQRVLDGDDFRRVARAIAVDMSAMPTMDDAVGALIKLARS